jgi:hypothetical protein
MKYLTVEGWTDSDRLNKRFQLSHLEWMLRGQLHKEAQDYAKNKGTTAQKVAHKAGEGSVVEALGHMHFGINGYGL